MRVHAQVTGTAKPLLDRTMNSLVDDLTGEAFNCFQKVEKFGMGGMLRVSCRLSFIFYLKKNSASAFDALQKANSIMD